MKPIVFVGRALPAIRAFPTAVRREAGYELDKVQRGGNPKDWKPMSDLGAGVREIRIRLDGAWRVVYVANLDKVTYVLHAFQKKSKKTSAKDIAAIKAAYKEVS